MSGRDRAPPLCEVCQAAGPRISRGYYGFLCAACRARYESDDLDPPGHPLLQSLLDVLACLRWHCRRR